MTINVVIICDLGHCSHRIPGLAESLTLEGFNIEIISPKMSSGQKHYFGIPETHNWKLTETKSFVMEYKRLSHLGRLPQRIYAYTKKRLRNAHSKYEFLKRISSFNKLLSTFTRTHRDWLPAVEAAVTQSQSLKRIDLIIASGTPFELFGIASTISAKFGIPWIADYRDLWSQNHAVAETSTAFSDVFSEKRILATASGVSTVSEECREALAQIYSGPIQVVKNASFGSPGKLKEIPSDPLTICYTGSIYSKFRDFTHIIKAVEYVNQVSPSKAVVKFIGPSNYLIKRFINTEKKYKDFVVLIDEKDRAFSFRAQEEADFLLVLNWEDKQRDGVLGTKIYEYFRAGVPILATGGSGNDELCEMLKTSRCGFISTEVENTADLIIKVITEKSYGLKPNFEFVNEFTYGSQAKYLESLIHEVLKV